MKIAVTLAAAGAGLAAGVLPALAADSTVTAKNYEFSPATVTVKAGDSVTFTNTQGGHNVVFADGSFTQPQYPSPPGWSVTRKFDAVGTFAYYCAPHGTADGQGMAGKVVVEPAPKTETAKTTTPSGEAPAQPSGSDTAGAAPVPDAAAGDNADVTKPGLWGRLARGVSCRRPRRNCTKPGVALRLGSNEDVFVHGSLRRRVDGGWRPAGLVRLVAPAGRSTVRFVGTSHGVLRPGTFELTLVARDAAGNVSDPWVKYLQIV